ncbi:MAG: hypothetical protein LCH93_05780 [Proteobacteria bacterium]|nr:hypothetical protein [Pseudomonadota bacterium]
MSRSSFLVALFCAVAVTPASVQALPALDCTGPFARDADESTVAAAFGAANVTRAEIPIGEGYTEPGTVVFASDDAKRIEILWHDSTARTRPATVIFRKGSTRRIAIAELPDRPVALGATLEEIEAMNGKPFSINGFGWDLGGRATGWHGGRLAHPVGGCTLLLGFDHAPDAPPDALEKVNGDVDLLSSDAALRQVKPVVVEMMLSWGQ